MSKRTKSFFEQNQGPKNYPNWKRSNTFNAPGRVEPTVSRDVMTGPPIAPGQRTKSKLKTFQFIEGGPEDHNKNKENRVGTSRSKQGEKKIVQSAPAGSGSKKDGAAAAMPSIPPPSTPATRLPLALLVGNSEDKSRGLGIDNSPEDHVYWQHNVSPRSSMPNTTPAPKRGKKRARSSSPATSSQPEKSTFFAEKDSFNLKNMQGTLRTPQADPAADLWNRYVPHGEVETPVSKSTAVFAHLMNESSPRSSATVGSVGGLRRWASCGMQWPTSKTKRRKLAGTFRETEDAISQGSGEDKAGKSNGSKAGRLLENILELGDAATRSKASSANSSPLAGISGLEEEHAESPSQGRGKLFRQLPPRNPSPTLNKPIEEKDRNVENKPCSPSSSDYGDVDLDMDIVGVLDNAKASETQPPKFRNPERTHSDPSTSQTLQEIPIEQKAVEATTVLEGAKFDDDEFDLGDDDIFDDDLGDLAALCDASKFSTATTVAGAVSDQMPAKPKLQHSPVALAPDKSIISRSSDDEFGSDDIDEDQLAAAEAYATQQLKHSGCTQTSNRTTSEIIDPLLIADVQETSYVDERGHHVPQKVLSVTSERRKTTRLVFLRQSWYETPCAAGSHVHVVGQCNSDGSYVVDDTRNLLILHPDQLLSATTVSESSECLRRSVLNDRVRVAYNKNAGLVYGSIIHEIFQEAIKTNRWDSQWLDQCALDILPKYLESILEIGLSEHQVLDHLKSKAPALQAWAKLFMREKPGVSSSYEIVVLEDTADYRQPQSVVDSRNGKKVPLSVSKLLDVEENIFSPAYGLKGKVDATVQIRTEDDDGEKTLTVPFELKTGRENISHRAQTALYTLLLSDRYDVAIAYGLLWNIETSSMSRVEGVRHLIRPLIVRRNELASWIRQRSVLPPVLTKYQFCDTCKVRDPCFIYDTLVEGGDGRTLKPKAKEKYDEIVRHLKPNHAQFFSKWQALLSKEEADMMKFRKELWTLLSKERERLGRCFSSVVIEPGSYQELHEGSRMNRFRYTFVKHKRLPGFSFAESQLVVGEPVVVSDEQGHYYLAKGFVTGVHKRGITVAVDRALHNARVRKPGFDENINQVFAGITELPGANSSLTREDEDQVIYRLDKDEFENGMGVPRNNLIQVMNDSVYKAADLRSLIVDQKSPTFKPSPTAYSLGSQSENLNQDQKAAIEKVMSAQDYALVLGMPGTGKTTTIAQIIRALVARGKSVLLTSFQHSAVDNILLKIRHDNIGILRLGAVSKVHSEVKEFAILAEEPKSTVEEIERAWNDPPVVAATCLKVDHPIFSRRIFDCCIVDEASQITLPVCLGPIRMAKTFVLVGDHYQLPPLVRNKDALAGGLDQSLFRILSEKHPTAVVNLEHQYRMNADIMTIASTLIYSGRLKCGSQAVANRTLHVPDSSAALSRCHVSLDSVDEPRSSICGSPNPSVCYLSKALHPDSRVLFLNTDRLGHASLEVSSSSTSATRVTNPMESTILTQIATLLLMAGIPGSDIGIITPHRSQLSLLKSNIRSVPHPGATKIELNTADKYQGRDKEIILVSFVRNNEHHDVGELLRDARRVNVAVTRARSKLIMVGSRSTLEGDALLRELIGLCDTKRWLSDLQPGCIDGHSFDEPATTQTTTTTVAISTQKAATAKVVPGKPTKSSTSPNKHHGKPKSPRKILGALEPKTINARVRPLGSQASQKSSQGSQKTKSKKMKVPIKGVVQGSLKGFLDKRPILRDLVNDAL